MQLLFMNYFSYGSNMSTPRLLERVPSARKTGTGMLTGHQLKFHKISIKDGSAKCDIFKTDIPQHIVYGVIFRIDPKDKQVLDIKEGLNNGYKQKEVKIKSKNNSTISCFTYYATKIDDALKPFDWYLEHVLRGAIENKLPNEYIDYIKTIETVIDTNIKRKEIELSIYR